MSSRVDRKREERALARQQRKQQAKHSVKDRIEEFKLNRQGKTKRKRSDVHSRYRRVDRILTSLILIVLLLFIIVWVYILFI